MNIDDILERHGIQGSYDTFHAKQAIKQIVEGVLKMAAEDAKTRINSEFCIAVDKQSILNVKDKITF